MQAAQTSTSESQGALEVINAFLAKFHFQVSEFILRKGAHFSEFTICGILLNMNWKQFFSKHKDNALYRKCIAFMSLFSGLLIAMIDETIQLFSYGRSSEVRDVWIDFAGICLGTIFIHILFRRFFKNNLVR